MRCSTTDREYGRVNTIIVSNENVAKVTNSLSNYSMSVLFSHWQLLYSTLGGEPLEDELSLMEARIAPDNYDAVSDW